MQHYYEFILSNSQCDFDKKLFLDLKTGKEWANGRGLELVGDKWIKYTVTIFRNGECIRAYKTE